MQKAKTVFSQMSFTDQSEAMTIICNIQMLQDKLGEGSKPFEYFENQPLHELRNMQDWRIRDYNAACKQA